MDETLALSPEDKQAMAELLFALEGAVHDTPLPNTYYEWVDTIDNIMDAMKKQYRAYYDRLYDLVIELQRVAKEHVSDIECEETVQTISHSGETYFQKMAYVVSEIRSLKSFVL